MAKTKDKSTPNRVKQIRQSTGLSQRKFSEKFHIPAINVSFWEQGVNNPTDYTLYMIERILELEAQLEANSKPEEASK